MRVWKPEGGSPIKAWVDGVPLEDAAVAQLENVSRMPFVHKHVAVMPDVHWGMGATVGSVVATRGAIIPAAVGVDLGCVDADTEYLSPDGWKRIADYDGGLVMQSTAEGQAGWVKPVFVKLPCQSFFHFKTKYGVDQMLSEEHRVLCWRITGRERRRERQVISARELAEEHSRLVIGARVEFETTFSPELVPEQRLGISDAQLRVQVMLMADGHLERGGPIARLRFRKRRKIERARELLTRAEMPFTEGVTTDGVSWFRFQAPIVTKTYKGWFAVCSLAELEIVAEECLHWDGNAEDHVFFTRDRDSADFIQFAFAATGHRAVMRVDYKDEVPDYRVFAHGNTMVGLGGVPKSPVIEVPSPDGFKYCFTTETGFWVMRRGGNIVLTGNCGMVAARTDLTALDLPDTLAPLRAAIERAVPHGRTNDGGPGDRGAWSDPPADTLARWARLAARFADICEKHPKVAKANSLNHLGTLGTGNHFIEVCLDEEQRVWVMLHSGSRGVGGRIGSYFIEVAKQEMRRWFVNLPDANLAYLPEGSEHFDDYCTAVEWAQDFASENRKAMLQAVLGAMRVRLRPFALTTEAVNCHHNYISREHHFGENVLVTRKGAVRAREGDLGIIPGSMGARSYIVRGKGNPDSFCSCSHGAGRAMSRTEAKKRFTKEDHEEATRGVECRKDADVIDETPGAYKDIDAVMAAQTDLVDVVHTLKQVLCVKG